jgi:hypothetical protein
MMFRRNRLLLATMFSMVLIGSDAPAQERCDCSKNITVCQAAISLNGQSFTMTSNTAQCSRLDWVLDKESKTTIVTDGKSSEPRLNTKNHPDFWLKGCYVCADTQFPGGRRSDSERTSTTNTLLGKWCSQDEKGKVSHTIDPNGIVTKLDFGRPGRKFENFSCNSSLTECKGEINGIKNVLGGDKTTIDFHYVFSFQPPNSGTLVINRLNAADRRTLGSSKTLLTRCE